MQSLSDAHGSEHASFGARHPSGRWLACHECDALQREMALPPEGSARCSRCGAVLYRNVQLSLDRTLALMLTALVLYVLANAFTLVSLDAQGNHTSATLFGAVRSLADDGWNSVAALVFVTSILMPALEISALLALVLPLRLGRLPGWLPRLFRVIQTARTWGMVEVFMIGTLVSLVKLSHLAQVTPGIALWAMGGLMMVLAAGNSAFDPDAFWREVERLQR
jgi:paraquat-inducible protein A